MTTGSRAPSPHATVREAAGQVTAPQPPDLTRRDALARYAPEREARRTAWFPHSRAARPDLLPWDLGLDWSIPAAEWAQTLGETLCAQHVARVDLRFTVAPTRAQALHLMHLMGLRVAPSATTDAIPPDWAEVVVYTSDYGGHVGQDKVRLPSAQARTQHPGQLCTLYLPPDRPPGTPDGVTGRSERDLIAGDHVLHLTMISRDWRSNVGTTDATWTDLTGRPTTGPYGQATDLLLGPLYAIDFVISGGVRWAVDFNTSPGATDAPVHQLPGGSIMGAVQNWRGWTA